MDRLKSRKKVLVAVRHIKTSLVLRALGPEFDIVMCHSYEEALANLDDQIGVIVCGVHFDDGRMFDFLRAAKDLPTTRSVPFLVVLGDSTQYSPVMLQGIRLAALLLGATNFIDLSEAIVKAGEEQVYERLRQGLRHYFQHPTPAALALELEPQTTERPEPSSSDNYTALNCQVSRGITGFSVRHR